MRPPHSLRHCNTCIPVGSTLWRPGHSLLEGMCYWGQTWNFTANVISSGLSRFASHFMPATCCHVPLPGQTHPSGSFSKPKQIQSFPVLHWAWCLTTPTEPSQGRLAFLAQVFPSVGMTGLYHHAQISWFISETVSLCRPGWPSVQVI